MQKDKLEKFLVVFITAPISKAKEIAKNLLEKKLVACVNTVNVESMYWWSGKIELDKEALLIIKTREKCFDKIKEVIKEIHPYEVPELIALEVSKGLTEYLKWIEEVTEC